MKKILLLSLSFLFSFLILPFRPNSVSAACGMIIVINDYEAEYSACTGTQISGEDVAGFAFDAESKTILLDGFNGKIEAVCMGTCGEEYGGAVAPDLKIVGESTINGLTYIVDEAVVVEETASTEESSEIVAAEETTKLTPPVEMEKELSPLAKFFSENAEIILGTAIFLVILSGIIGILIGRKNVKNDKPSESVGPEETKEEQ
ncbi:hypothetical protein IJ380_00920 [Candidatus Saccharibacteria bacterium]|nr:hypothetical protein [Candidatus Saccharibacteria bacterium]